MRKHAALTRYLTYDALIVLEASLAVQLATSGAGMVLRLFRGETAAEITFIDLLGILLLELAPIVGLALLSLKSENIVKINVIIIIFFTLLNILGIISYK